MAGRGKRRKINETTLFVKPLSVNQCWQGRRFKTKKYQDYEKIVDKLLPDNFIIPRNGPLILFLHFGFSSAANDWDNPIKPFQDILQKKYGFNDSRIYEAHISKELVKKGDEFIYFKILKL